MSLVSIKTPEKADSIMKDAQVHDSVPIKLKKTPKGDYNTLKQKIRAHKQEIKKLFISVSDSLKKQEWVDSVGNYLISTLVHDIFPFWYGTQYGFEGYTEIPQQGKIACGYFVSTTIRDVGFNLDRFEFAKQNPKNEARSINITDSIMSFHYLDDDAVKELGDGLYFVGLDFHVGYLLITDNQSFFIHSNYMDKLEVMIEYAETSGAILASRNYWIAEVSNNKKLIEKWILGTKIDIIRASSKSRI